MTGRISRVMVAVDDSPAALAAARLAVALAQGWGGCLRAVAVVADHAITEQLRAELAGRSGPAQLDRAGGLAGRRTAAANAVLRHVAGLAERSGVPVETVQVEGDVAAELLEQARTWPADLIVLGRSDLPGAGQPYVGRHTRHVLEFAEQPVLVVPAGRR